MVLRKRPPLERRRHCDLEWFCLEAWLARFHDAAVSGIKERSRRCRPRRHRVYSGPDGFRGRATEIVTSDEWQVTRLSIRLIFSSFLLAPCSWLVAGDAVAIGYNADGVWTAV